MWEFNPPTYHNKIYHNHSSNKFVAHLLLLLVLLYSKSSFCPMLLILLLMMFTVRVFSGRQHEFRSGNRNVSAKLNFRPPKEMCCCCSSAPSHYSGVFSMGFLLVFCWAFSTGPKCLALYISSLPLFNDIIYRRKFLRLNVILCWLCWLNCYVYSWVDGVESARVVEKAQRRENYIRHVNGRQVFPTSLCHQYSASGNMEICHEQEGGWWWSSSVP